MEFQIDPNADADTRLAVIGTVVLDMHRRLFGNGQPGELEKINKRIDTLESQRDTAIGGATAVGKVVAIGMTVGTAVGGAAFAAVKFLVGK